MGLPVKLEGVSKTYPNSVVGLKPTDLSFEPGKVTVLLGPSGAGKSTLLRLINGLETATTGQIRVGDLAVTPKSLRAIRQQVGMVFQQFNLVPRLTVMANVLCGRLAYRSWVNALFFSFPESDFELASEAMKQVGVGEKAWMRADQLSGGQPQRVAIARTMVQEARVILADEPVASLDPTTSKEVMDILVAAAKSRGATLIINLHQVDLAKTYADRLIGLKNGSILFDVASDQLTEELVEELYRANP